MFSEDITQVAEWLDDEHKPSGNVRAEYVSGEMPTVVRRQKPARLRNVVSGEIGILSNARCLSEGVDVPALDGVAFIDPRSSEIDIIQSVGRAIRLSENKTMGTIVIPVFIEQNENAEAELQKSEFKPMWEVLDALKSHDERLSDELDQLRIELGAKRKRSIRAGDLTKIVFDLPTSVNENFARSLRVQVVERTTSTWLFYYGFMQAFVREHGHCRVPKDYKTDTGFWPLRWISGQRHLRDRMDIDRRRRLEALPGWRWTPFASQWDEGFSHLEAFSKREGHSQVPPGHETGDGFRLGLWVSVQRDSRSKKRMTVDRRDRLEALPGWLWVLPSLSDSFWEQGFSHLKEFSDRHGHCQVMSSQKTDDGHRLGNWLSNQRALKNKMQPHRRKRLEALPGWSWSRHEQLWQEGFAHLREFSTRFSHCRVPGGYKCEDGFGLGDWVSNQKGKKDKMDSDRRKRLEALPGWLWVLRSDSPWEQRFSCLKEFSDRHGHCRVPRLYQAEDGSKLAVWVATQRRREFKMDPARKKLLETMLGWSWGGLSDKWEVSFSELQKFSQREGHSRVTVNYRTDDGVPLGRWAAFQRGRFRRGKMEPDHRQRLEAMPGWLWEIEK